MLLRTVMTLVAVYAALLLLLFVFQSRLVFLPHVGGRDLAASPTQVGLDYQEVWLDTADDERLHAWWLPHPEARGALHFSHGNAGNISHRLDSLAIFHELGLSVLIYDYRGYGQSSGRVGEEGLDLDAEAAWRWMVDEADVPPERIVLFGRSMGGAVAARLAGQVEAGALILESTFTSVPDIAGEIYWWLPVRWLARIRLDARAALADCDQPTLIVHSRDDEIVPFSHAEGLLEAAPSSARLLEIRGSHNTGFLTSGDLYRDGLDEFLTDHLDD
ncbi:MAG: alpha/beta hydrolase [Wenzhouxiangella sp.]|nr:MAG: alpha/beta hydrolase [Wenzhouxiangella sp.]